MLHQSDVLSSVLELVRLLLPALEASSRRTAPIGAHRRAAEALATLHTAEKTFINTDTLMVRIGLLLPAAAVTERSVQNWKACHWAVPASSCWPGCVSDGRPVLLSVCTMYHVCVCVSCTDWCAPCVRYRPWAPRRGRSTTCG